MEKIIKLEEFDETINRIYEEMKDTSWDNHEVRLEPLSDGTYKLIYEGTEKTKSSEVKSFHM